MVLHIFEGLGCQTSVSCRLLSFCLQRYTPEMLQPCIQKLKPAYVEFMPPTYEPPKQHGCSKGNEPEYVVKGMEHKEAGFGTRIFSQCNRVDIAQDYILNVFEPKVRQQYDVFIKVRPDTIYLTDVPPLWSLNVSTITSATGGLVRSVQCLGKFNKGNWQTNLCGTPNMLKQNPWNVSF